MTAAVRATALAVAVLALGSLAGWPRAHAAKPASKPGKASTSAADVAAFGEAYRAWLTAARTSLLAVDEARRAALARGFRVLDLAAPPEAWPALAPGDGVFVAIGDRAALVARVGTRAIVEGLRLAVAHVDAPALRIDPRPRVGKKAPADVGLLTAYAHGGLKPYQWASRPLSIVGIVAPVYGPPVRVHLGPDDGFAFLLRPRGPGEPIPTTLAPAGADGEPEDADAKVYEIVGATSAAAGDAAGGPRARLFAILQERWGLVPEDLEAAELYAVPAEEPRDAGLDRAYVLGSGQDDRACAYAALRGVLDLAGAPEVTAGALLVDREETGSAGRSGMRSELFELAVAALLRARGEAATDEALATTLRRSAALSTDTKGGIDPAWPEVHDLDNAPVVGSGPTIVKATGHRGKYHASDAAPEMAAWVRTIAREAGVPTQDSESGKVDEGGGGTVARFLAERGMDVLDVGIPILSMHAPFELSAKSDVRDLARLVGAFFAAKARPRIPPGPPGKKAP